MSNFIIEDDRLIRYAPVYRDDTMISMEQLVITKEEFLACYNRWVQGDAE